MSNSKLDIRTIAETAILAALAFALSFLTINIAETFYVEFSVIPIIFLALRRGVKWGFIGALILAILFFAEGKFVMLPMKTLLLQYLDGPIEYILAPLSLAVAGLWKSKNLSTSTVIFAALAASLLKYFWHFIAGGIFWASYAPKGWNAWLFSLVTQGLSGLMTAAAAAIILVIIFKSLPRLFQIK